MSDFSFYEASKQLLYERKWIAESLLQRKFQITYERAHEIIEKLQPEIDKLKPKYELMQRKILEKTNQPLSVVCKVFSRTTNRINKRYK